MLHYRPARLTHFASVIACSEWLIPMTSAALGRLEVGWGKGDGVMDAAVVHFILTIMFLSARTQEWMSSNEISTGPSVSKSYAP